MCKHPFTEISALAARAGVANTRTAVLLLIVITGVLHLALAGLLGLSVDESYTVAISRQIALSYLDHPPLHIWLVGFWARLVGTEQPLLLRLPDVVMFAASTWLMYRLTAAFHGERAGAWAALALNLAPVFTVNAAIGITPDGPLMLFSLFGVACFIRALAPQTSQAARTWRMLAAGAAVGLALLSKYMAVFVVLSLAMYLFTSRRHLLATPGPWLAALLAGVLFVPVLLWNGAHGWASFAFQSGRALPTGIRPERAAIDFAGQLLYLLPWLAVGSLCAMAGALRRGPRNDAAWLFVCLAAIPIAFFSMAALWTKVLPHWPAIGWLFALPLLGQLLAGMEQTRPRLLRATAAATASLLICAVSMAAWQARTGWLDRSVPALAANDPTLDLLNWYDLRSPVAQLQARDPDMFVATVSWIDAGKAAYALGGTIPVLCVSRDPRQFAFMRDPRALNGHEALIVAAAGRPDWLQIARPYFRRIDRRDDVVLTRDHHPALTLHTAYGYGFNTAHGFARPRSIAKDDNG